MPAKTRETASLMPSMEVRVSGYRKEIAGPICAPAALWCVLFALILATGARAQQDSSTVAHLTSESIALMPLVKTDVARRFLAAVPELPTLPAPRVAFVNRAARVAVSPMDYAKLSDSARADFERREYGEDFYYYTRYGTPLAFVRPLDLVAQAGLPSLDKALVVDFGFGSIGQLRLMASLGAYVVGIEVDPLLEVIYDDPSDFGAISRAAIAGEGPDGDLRLAFGSFPGDTLISHALGSGYDIFFSKNTLKRGYVHPEREVDPRMLVHLGVDDSTFVQTVYDLLKPGGFFMIYNLCPAPSKPDEPYKPWSDGRSPFARDLCERIGFDVLAFDRDDTEFARTMGSTLGWGEQMDLANDLFGTYTLLRK